MNIDHLRRRFSGAVVSDSNSTRATQHGKTTWIEFLNKNGHEEQAELIGPFAFDDLFDPLLPTVPARLLVTGGAHRQVAVGFFDDEFREFPG